VAITKSNEATLTDWTAVAQNAVGESGELVLSDAYWADLMIQAFLDGETAHTGTRFVVQASFADSGDEDWADLFEFVGLIDASPLSEALTNDPLEAAGTTITMAATADFVNGAWHAIEESTLANSELFWQVAVTTNTSVTTKDGVTNEHAKNTVCYTQALSRTFRIDGAYSRARVLVDNTYDADGCTLDYKVRYSKVTAG